MFSFHAVKNLTTGEGGAVCMNFSDSIDCDELYKTLNMKSLHGQSKDALAKTQVGNWRYDVLEPGYKCNMMDLQAAIGLVELERYSESLEKRAAIFDHYTTALKDKPWAIIPPSIGEEKVTSYHLYLLSVDGATEAQRDAIIQKIFEQKVSVNVHFQPLPMLTVYKSRGYNMEDFPISYAKYSNVITLPVYFDLTKEQLNTITTAVIKAVEEVLN